jgi:CBS domain-containing protein
VTCTASDSLGKLLTFLKEKRIHRLIVVGGEGPDKGKLAGMITLSDVLKYIVGGGKETISLAAGLERMSMSSSMPNTSGTLSISISAPNTPAIGSTSITPSASTQLSPAVENPKEAEGEAA